MKTKNLLLISAVLISPALAQDMPDATLAQNLWNWFIGNWAVWIVVASLVSTACAALFFKQPWKYFMYVIMGSVLLFGAKKFADVLKNWATSGTSYNYHIDQDDDHFV